MTTKKFYRLHTEIVNGVCPECAEYTMLVGVTRKFYRCITCGSDLEQHINGKISYIPALPNIKNLVEYFDGEEI